MEKIMGRGKGSSVKEIKACVWKQSKNKGGLFSAFHQQAISSHIVGSRAPVCNTWLNNKCLSSPPFS